MRALCVLLVGAVALAASLGPLLRAPERARGGIGPFGDTSLYLMLAYNLDAGHGFSGTLDRNALGVRANRPAAYVPSVARGPVYPFFIATVYRTFGRREAMPSANTWPVNWDRVRIAQCVLHAFTSMLVYAIARTIWHSAFWPAIAAGLLQACGVYSLYYTRAILSETLTAFLVTLSILLVVRALRAGRLRWWIAAGVALGITVLSRPEYLAAPVLLAAYAWRATRSRGRVALLNAVALLIATACVIAPWTLRNLRVSGRPVLVAEGGVGLNLYLGTFETPQTWQGWSTFSDSIYILPGEKQRLAEAYSNYQQAVREGSPDVIPTDAALRRLAFERIRARPRDALAVWLTKMPRLWYQNYIAMYQQREASGAWFLFYALFASAAFWYMPAERRMLMGVVVTLFVYLNVIFFPLHVEPRYGVALMPGIVALAGIGLGAMFRRFAGRRAG